MIYVVRTAKASPSFIKIGYAKEDIGGRIQSLQTGCPFKLELIKKLSGDVKDERRLHLLAAKFRINGEWFRDCPELMELLGIKYPKAIKMPEKKKPKMAITDRFKYLNQPFKPTMFYGVKKRRAFELTQFCERFGVKKFEVLDFPLRLRMYHATKMTYEQAKTQHNFDGEPFEGISVVLTPKPGSRHKIRAEKELGYITPIAP